MNNNEYEQVVAQWKNNYINYNDDNVNCYEDKDFVASWDYTLMSISLPS